jgi:hypothetical protein
MTCGATTIAAVGLATTVAATGASAYGQMQKGQADAAQASYQSGVARRNQMLAQQNADRATQQGEVDAQNQGLKTRQIMGGQKASLAAQGGDIDSGSPANIIGDTAMAGYSDQEGLRYNAAMKAYAYQVQGAGAGASADNLQRASTASTDSLPFGVGSTILGGAAKGAGQWYSYMKNNPGTPTAKSYGSEYDL